MSSFSEQAYCTLVMSDSYLPGALVLAHSLRDAGTKKKLAVLITLDTLGKNTITQLKAVFDYLLPVPRIANPKPANLFHMQRGDLIFAFTKIALWRQTQFRRIVYMDADTVALRAPDELFDTDADFSAAPDVGWPDAFNTGVMVLKPNMGDYWALQTLASSGDSFDGADQGLINQYYEHRNWNRLSFTYNTTPSAQYQWEPAYRHYKSNISVVHFIGKDKPWSFDRSGDSGGSGVYHELLGRWWAVHDRHLKSPYEESVAEQPAAPPGTEPSPKIGETSAAESTWVEKAEIPEQQVQTDTETPTKDLPDDPKYVNWDATQSEPPSHSLPEAANLPSEHYAFSETRQLFHPPTSYPAPPTGMWYQVPRQNPDLHEKPKPIFPWEKEREMPKATRVFVEDSSPLPTPPVSESTTTEPPLERDVDDSADPGQISTASFQVEEDQRYSRESQQSANVWDGVPGIDRYVRAVMDFRAQRAAPAGEDASINENPLSPIEDAAIVTRRGRILADSLVLTDFPTAMERPSLPVTPLPVQRSMWGDEKDDDGELPAAEGVPAQADWDPQAQLDRLRRNSLLEIEHLNQAAVAAQAATASSSAGESSGSTLIGDGGGSDSQILDPPQEAGKTITSFDASGRRLSTRDMPAHAAPMPVASPTS